MYWVYILKSNSNNDYVVGQTADLEDSIDDHKSGREENANKACDWRLVYSKKYTNRTEAQTAEEFIKNQQNSKFIEQVITGRIDLDTLPESA